MTSARIYAIAAGSLAAPIAVQTKAAEMIIVYLSTLADDSVAAPKAHLR